MAATRFGGLKLDDKGVITYHGSTSFFQSFSHHFDDGGSSPSQAGSSPRAHLEGAEKRERLVNNAWQQRALESLTQIPVGKAFESLSLLKSDLLLHRSRFSISSACIGVGSSLCSTSSTVQLLAVRTRTPATMD
jgi:hypothetical protein